MTAIDRHSGDQRRLHDGPHSVWSSLSYHNHYKNHYCHYQYHYPYTYRYTYRYT